MTDRTYVPVPEGLWNRLEQPRSWSDAVRIGGLVFCTGQVGWDKTTGEMVGPSIEDQTRKALENLEEVLASVGGSLTDVAIVRVYLTDAADHDRFDPIYAEFFPSNPPARVTVAVSELIDRGCLIDIEAIAVLDPNDVPL